MNARGALRHTVDSEGHRLLTGRITQLLERKRVELESFSQAESLLRFYQGYVAALRCVLDLPRILDEELAAKGEQP